LLVSGFQGKVKMAKNGAFDLWLCVWFCSCEDRRRSSCVVRDLTHIRRRRRRRRRGRHLEKLCFYFTLEFRIYLELFRVSVGIKTCRCWICYECVQFQIEVRKINRCWSRSPDNAQFGDNNGVTGLNNCYPRVIPALRVLLELVYIFEDLPLLYGTIGGSLNISLSNNPVFRRTSHQIRAVRGHRSAWFPLLSACNL